jgi:hypothetical protein
MKRYKTHDSRRKAGFGGKSCSYEVLRSGCPSFWNCLTENEKMSACSRLNLRTITEFHREITELHRDPAEILFSELIAG